MINEKKTTWVFVFQMYGKFWSVSVEHFVKPDPVISKELPPKKNPYKLQLQSFNLILDKIDINYWKNFSWK